MDHSCLNQNWLSDVRYADFRRRLSPRDDKSSHDSLDSKQQMPPADQAHKEDKLGFL